MKEIIIKGYYGRDNLGDEIMLGIFAEYVLTNFPTWKLMIMNSSPDYLLSKYKISTPMELITGKRPGMKVLLRRFFRIVGADVFSVGGGTILTDKHSYLHLLEYTIYFVIRKLLRKKSLFISVGSTQFKTGIGKAACKILLSTANVCAVRDAQSFEELKKIADSPKIVLTGDLVNIASQYISNISWCKANDEIKKIGICVMPYYYSLYKDRDRDLALAEELAHIIDTISEKYKAEIFFIPIQFGKGSTLDYDFSNLVNSKCKDRFEIKSGISIEEKIDFIKEADLVISMRLHALMIGILLGKKIIAIDHNEKIHAFMKNYGLLKYNVDFNNLESVTDLVSTIDEDNEDYFKYQARIQDEEKKALSNLNILGSLMS